MVNKPDVNWFDLVLIKLVI